MNTRSISVGRGRRATGASTSIARRCPTATACVLVVLQERTIADKIDRQLTHRGAVRSVSGLASMLAHEIKNPLSGIRGAAQLLESRPGRRRSGADAADLRRDRPHCPSRRPDGGVLRRAAAEARAGQYSFVLDHVKRVAHSGFARHVRFVENYDPSLPPVYANRDQLVQVFLNLVKNAAEAIGDDASTARSSSPPPSGPASACGRSARSVRSACRWNSACATMAAAFRRTSPRISSIPLSPRNHPELASDLHWWRRSSMTTAASSNANSLPEAHDFPYSHAHVSRQGMKRSDPTSDEPERSRRRGRSES